MTNIEREIWRQAFVLYDNNREMPSTEDAWMYFIQKLADFARANDWRDYPLARALHDALIEAVEGNIKKREKEQESQPHQLSMQDVIHF